MKAGLFLVFLTVKTFNLEAGAANTPLLLMPGISGSQLWGTVENIQLCNSDTPRLLWVSISTLFCTSALELQYNSSTNTYSDREGVDVSVPGFGDTSSVECLTVPKSLCRIFSPLAYYDRFVDYFVARGYQRGVDIRAAPYDWRLAADSHAVRGYFNNLRALAEEMYNRNNDTPVALVAHSMGGLMSLYFLNKVVTQEWKDKYIKVYIPLSVPWGGASEPIQAVVSGLLNFDFFPQLGMSLLNSKRSLQSMYWLMPRAEIFGDQELVKTPTVSYTARDHEQMFTTFANYPLGWTQYNATSSINAGYKYPEVPTHCFYGSEVATPLTYVYSSNDPTKTPTIVMGSGDGTVNKVSLEVCLWWANITNNGTGFQSRAFPGIQHTDMVRNAQVFNAIGEIVMAGPPSSSVIARVNIYSTMVLLAAAFAILFAAM